MAVHIETGTMVSPHYSSQQVDHLGLVAGRYVEGRYNSNEVPEEGVIHITQGYSQDHRPDLNPVVLQ